MHNWKETVSIILPPSLVFLLALTTGIISKLLLISHSDIQKKTVTKIEMIEVSMTHSNDQSNEGNFSKVTAEKLIYGGKNFKFTNPKITSYLPNDDIALIKANLAIANVNFTLIDLSGDAEIRQINKYTKDSDNKLGYTVKSDELRYEVKNRLVLTNKKVILESNRFVITGTGLEFSLPEQTLDIFTNSSFSSKATED
jgi:LPS export ABC transporter protein LptC